MSKIITHSRYVDSMDAKWGRSVTDVLETFENKGTCLGLCANSARAYFSCVGLPRCLPSVRTVDSVRFSKSIFVTRSSCSHGLCQPRGRDAAYAGDI